MCSPLRVCKVRHQCTAQGPINSSNDHCLSYLSGINFPTLGSYSVPSLFLFFLSPFLPPSHPSSYPSFLQVTWISPDSRSGETNQEMERWQDHIAMGCPFKQELLQPSLQIIYPRKKRVSATVYYMTQLRILLT